MAPRAKRTTTGKAILGLVALFLFGALAVGATADDGSGAPAPTLSSDRETYVHGDTVTLSGAAWMPGQMVHLRVAASGDETWSAEDDVLVGADGTISASFELPAGFAADFGAVATGLLGETASTSFTSAFAAASAPPTIVTDKDDYMPGETVTLTGASWAAGEAVHIHVNDDQGQTWSHDADVTADSGGSFTYQFQLPNWFVASYTVTATGPVSGTATTSFTDGTVSARNATTTPASVAISYRLERFGNTTCSGNPQTTGGSPNNFTRTGPTSSRGGSSSIASGNTESVRVSVTGVSAGFEFDKWHFVDGNVSGDGAFFSNDQSFCFETENNTNRTFIAFVKVANTAPTAVDDSDTTDEARHPRRPHISFRVGGSPHRGEPHPSTAYLRLSPSARVLTIRTTEPGRNGGARVPQRRDAAAGRN